MPLVALIDGVHDELAADMQQYYGIDLERAFADGSHSPLHLAALAAQLPAESRVGRAHDEDNAYTLDTVYLAACFNALQAIMCALGGGGRPKPAGPAWMRTGGGCKLAAQVMSIDELERKLADFEKGG